MIVIAGDLGLRRPAIAVMRCADNKVQVLGMFVVDTKKDTKMKHGEILAGIDKCIREEVIPLARKAAKKHSCGIIAIRERSFSKFNNETQAIYRVVGITDLALYAELGVEWLNATPQAIRKLVVGTGRASKDDVSMELSKYLDKPLEDFKFLGNDETDAIAVGLFWMMGNGYIKREEHEASDGDLEVQVDSKPRRTVRKGTKEADKK